jgi:trehalose-phosphatase
VTLLLDAATIAGLATTDRLLVASDFDGVLSPIVADPAAAAPLPAAVDALAALVATPDTWVAVVSGRDRAQLERLVPGADRFVLVGSHGAEISGLGNGGPPPVHHVAPLDETVDVLHGLAARHPGLHVEVKALSVAAHLRRVPPQHRAEAEAAVIAVAETWPGRVIEGKEVVELAVAGDNKGDAVADLRDRTGATATVYLGDDVTDEDVFVTLDQPDVGIKVGPGDTAASHRVDDPEAVASLLTALAAQRAAACQRD